MGLVFFTFLVKGPERLFLGFNGHVATARPASVGKIAVAMGISGG